MKIVKLKLHWSVWSGFIFLLVLMACVTINLYAVIALFSKDVQLRLDMINHLEKAARQ